jgi:hypothetical protein
MPESRPVPYVPSVKVRHKTPGGNCCAAGRWKSACLGKSIAALTRLNALDDGFAAVCHGDMQPLS